MIQDFGFGAEKTLSCLSKYGCAVEILYGCLAPGFPTYTEAIVAVLAIQEH